MRREVKIKRARKLREEGWTLRAIADRYGVTPSAVWRWCEPGFAERRKAYDAKYRAEHRESRNAQQRAYRHRTRPACPECGQPMWHKTTLCEGCRTDQVEARRRQIETWWAGGLSLREVADELGWTLPRLSVEVHRMREYGYDLPYRNQHRSNAPRFPEQVAA